MLESAISQDLLHIVRWSDIETLNTTIIRPAMSKFLESKDANQKKLPTFTLKQH